MDQDPKANHGWATFQTLPVEILLCIFDFLDIQDKTCLSFCNHFLRDIIDTPTRRQRHLDMLSRLDERQDFLQRLVRDHPDHVVCKVCSTIHHMTRLAPLAAIMHEYSKCYPRFPQRRGRLDRLDRIDLRSVYKLNRGHVRLAMERYRYGSGYGIPLNLLSIREVEEEWLDIPRFTRMLSVEPKIMVDELYLRIQDLWLLPPALADEILIASVEVEFCRHHVNIAFDVLLCKLRHSNRFDDCPTCCQHQSCNICSVEFQADIRTFADGRRIVIVTRLMNLGDGRDQPDTRWKLLTGGYRPPDLPRGKAVESMMIRGSDKTWCSVEDRGLRPLGEMTDLNISTLCSESYKVDFTRLIWERWLDFPSWSNRHWVHQTDTDVGRFWPRSRPSLLETIACPRQNGRHSMNKLGTDAALDEYMSSLETDETIQQPRWSDNHWIRPTDKYKDCFRWLLESKLAKRRGGVWESLKRWFCRKNAA